MPRKQQRDFYNRGKETERFKKAFINDEQRLVTIIGERCIGKTAFMLMVNESLAAVPAKRFVPIFFSAQWKVRSFKGFAKEILQRFCKYLGKDLVDTGLLGKRGDFQEPDRQQLIDTLNILLNDISGQFFIISIDEFDKLLTRDDLPKEEALKILGWIQSVIDEHALPVVFCISISREPDLLIYSQASPLTAAGDIIELQPFSRAETATMVYGLIGNRTVLAEKVLERLYALSGGHPFFIKLLLSDLLRRYQQTNGPDKLDDPWLQDAVHDDALTILLENIYDTDLLPAEQKLLLLLANYEEGISRIRLQSLGPEYVTAALELVTRGYLVAHPQGMFDYRIGLLRFWFRGWSRFEREYQRLDLLVLEVVIEEEIESDKPTEAAMSLTFEALQDKRQGEYAEAEALLRQALSIYEPESRSELHSIFQNLINLAFLCYAQEKYGEAETFLKRALTTYEQVSDPDPLSMAQCLKNLAFLCRVQKKYGEAETFLKRALTTYEQVSDPDPLSIAQCLISLAFIYFVQDTDTEAEPLLRQALSTYELVLRPEQLDRQFILTTLDEQNLNQELSYLDQVTGLNDLGLLLHEKADLKASHLCYALMQQFLASPPALKPLDASEKEIVGQEVGDWIQNIIRDMDLAQTSRSRLARTTALNRIIGMLSSFPPGRLDYFSLTGNLLIQRIIDRWREVVTREAGREGKIEIRSEVASPYIFTVPIESPALVGRDDLFRRIASLWARPGQRNSLLIYGHRRMGKTSLAQALASRCNFGSDTRLVYLSMETVDLDHESHLYYEIADRLWLEIQDGLPEPEEGEFTSPRSRTSFNRFLARLNAVVKKVLIVLVLDEFELIQRSLGLERTAEVITYLRAQTQTYHWLTLGLVGLNDLDDLRRSYRNPLLGWESMRVSFLDATEVANILANPPYYPDFPLDYAPEALDMIATVTNGQPYLVQVIGDLLVQHYNHVVFTEHRVHNAVFDVTDVQSVVDDPAFYDTAAAYFEGVWDQVTRGQPEEVTILQALADFTDGLEEFPLRAMTDLEEEIFLLALDVLKRHDVLCLKDDRICYTVPLMRRWVHETRRKTPSNISEGRSDESKDSASSHLPTLTIHIDQPDFNEVAPLKLTLSIRNAETVSGQLKLPFPLGSVPLVIRALNARQYSDYPTHERLIRTGEDRKQIVATLRDLGLWDDSIFVSSSSESGAVPADVHARVGRLLGSALLTIPEFKKFLDALYYEAIRVGGGEIILSFHPKAVSIAALPWEITHNNLQPILLAKGVVLSCTRVITFDHPLPPPRPDGQRLLVLTIAPRARMDDTGRAFEQLARSRLRENLRNLPVDVESLPIATMSALRERLSKDPVVDILDYFGHGSFTKDGGALVMEGEHGSSDLVTASRLQALGNLLPSVIVLHACQSAQLGLDEPLAGLAAALSSAGVRAVLAMQFTTRMPAVTNQVIPVFYKELASGKSVQQAVAAVRQALYAEEPDGASWYLPVLYLRSSHQQPYYLLKRTTSLSDVSGLGSLRKKEHMVYSTSVKPDPPPNPFAGAGALEDAKRFIGRESQVRRLWERLRAGSNLTIIGPAGSGKSAMLRLIAEEAQQRISPTTEVIQVPIYPMIKRSDVHKLLVSWMGGQRDADLIRLLRNRHLILLLDDLGLLDKGRQGLEVRSWLHQLTQNRQVGKVQLVATSQQPLHEVFKDDRPSDGSPLHNSLRDFIPLNEFLRKEAELFIAKALVGTPFSKEEFADLLYGSLMPGSLQERCRDCYDKLYES